MNPEELKKESQIAYDKWFERWYANEKIESELKQAAMQGYTAYGIVIRAHYDDYLKRRMKDDRFVEKLRDKLSEFTVYKKEPRRYERTLLGRHLGYGWTETEIVISWRGEVES